MVKKITLIFCLLFTLFLLSSCTEPTVEKTAELMNSQSQAMILLPDGSVVKGTCTFRVRHSGNWITLIIDGMKYRVNDWRVAIIEPE